MYGWWTFFVLEIKKFLRVLPFILAETLLFGAFLSGVGLFASKALYGERAVGEIRIGIVTQEEDRMTDMLIRFASSMDSLKDTVSFVPMSEDEAREELAEGEIYGAVLLPEGLVESILTGENKPAVILLDNTYSKMETEIFARLADAGAALLGTAQAAIYAADAFCVENGWEELVFQSEDYLNQVYMELAMGRMALLKEREVSAFKGVNFTDYYGISLFLAFLSFAGLSFGKYMQVENGEREKMLCARGMGTGQRYLMETAAFALVFSFLGFVFGMPFCLALAYKTASTFVPCVSWLWMGIVLAAAGIFLRALFQLTGNHPGGLGAAFTVLMGMMAASGMFVPSSFLPLWAEKLGSYFPYKNWMDTLALILQGRFEAAAAVKVLLSGLFFLLVGWMIALGRQQWAKGSLKRVT